MRQRITLMCCLLAALLLPNISAIAQEDKLEVIASHSILADVVHNIAGDRIELATLIPVGADPHTFQPSPRELTALAEADLIFVNGAGIEEALLEVIESAAEDSPIVEISACVAIIPIGAAGHMHDDDDHAHEDDDHAHEDDDHGDDDHAHEHDDDHAHEDDDDHGDEHEDDDDHGDEHEDDDQADEHEDDHDHEDHADEHHHADMDSHCAEHDAEFLQIMGGEDARQHGPAIGRLEDIDCGGGHDHDHEAHTDEEGACDPHVWMDPQNVIYWSLMIRDVLSELDPAHAADYAAAAADYISQLLALENDFILPLLETLPADQRVLVTSHDSLGYLAHAYDFVIVSAVIPGGGTQVEPSARDVAALIDLVKDAGVAAIFGETTVSASVLQTIAAETGAELAILYSGTLTEAEPAATYLRYMRYNLGAIVEALGVSG